VAVGVLRAQHANRHTTPKQAVQRRKGQKKGSPAVADLMLSARLLFSLFEETGQGKRIASKKDVNLL